MAATHDGHRKRMRERFRISGLEGFSEHEVLELILFYGRARGNVNDTAHALMDVFGSLPRVLEASPEQLMLIDGIGETLYMTLGATFLGYLFGLPMGILLTVSDRDGLKPNAFLYKILDVIANLVRSIPFLILLILIIPFTRLVVGKSYGPTATIVPLTLAAIPFIARMVESSLKEVDAGVIEAARSMGASNFTIITRVILVEARTSLITNATIAIGTILGYTAMAGTVGGGGLGDIAVRYGYHRWQMDIMFVTVFLLILLVQLFQTIGMAIANRLDKRK